MDRALSWPSPRVEEIPKKEEGTDKGLTGEDTQKERSLSKFLALSSLGLAALSGSC